MRVVVDTNLIISGIFYRGLPRKLLEFWMDNRFELFATQEIVQEYVEVIEDFGKARNKELVHRATVLLLQNLTLIENQREGSFSRDPDDDKFIHCALSAGAKYIISGDKDLLSLKEVELVKIVTAREFFEQTTFLKH